MGEEFDILQHPDTLKNVCSSAIVSGQLTNIYLYVIIGFGAAVAFGAFSMTRPCKIYFNLLTSRDKSSSPYWMWVGFVDSWMLSVQLFCYASPPKI